MFSRRGLVALLALAAITSGAPAATAWAGSGWSPTGDTTAEHGTAAMVKLLDGRALVISGDGSGVGYVPAAEIYHPATGTWSLAAPPLVPRREATATVLLDGRVLLVGGGTAGGVTNHAELYDPAANTWTATGPMATPRRAHSAALLPGGRVLVAGGVDGAGDPKATGEVYDPATGSWSTVPGGMSVGRADAQSATLADGRVLVAGGHKLAGGLAFYRNSDVYDPALNAWTPTADLPVERSVGAAVRLPDGRVLVGGGVNASGAVGNPVLYDPGTGTWSTPPGLSVSLGTRTTLTALEGGSVLFTGSGTRATSVFDPVTMTASALHVTAVTRGTPTLVRLDDGRVLLTGGIGLRSAELYTPLTTRSATGGAFGDVAVGETAERDVTFTNTGTERWRIGAPSFAGPDAAAFVILDDNCSFGTLMPGQTCTARVRFTAQGATGARSAQLTFDDNAETSPPAALTAVVAAPRGEPQPPAPPGPHPQPQPQPQPQPTPAPVTPRTTTPCGSRRRIVVRLGLGRRDRLRSGTVTLNGKRLAALKAGARSFVVDLRKRPYGTYIVRVRAQTTAGRDIAFTRTYRTCRPRKG